MAWRAACVNVGQSLEFPFDRACFIPLSIGFYRTAKISVGPTLGHLNLGVPQPPLTFGALTSILCTKDRVSRMSTFLSLYCVVRGFNDTDDARLCRTATNDNDVLLD